VLTLAALALGLYAISAQAQTASPAPTAAAATASQPWSDPLGRSTPRGTLTGFLDAARAGDHVRAAQYLNAQGRVAETRAHQLFVVLDARLPARLTRISDQPEGSRANPLMPNRDIVGVIPSSGGGKDIVLERVARGDPQPIWLFARETLVDVPALYEEVASSREGRVPRFLVETRIGGVRLLDLLAVLLGLPVLYLLTLLLNRLLTPLVSRALRRAFRGSTGVARSALPAPARVLVVTAAASLLVSRAPLSLTLRQLWSSIAGLVTIGAIVWLLIRLNGEIERYIQRRMGPANVAAAASLLRVLRRSVDLLILFGGTIATLRYFGVDPTPALAGLGVGGIAIALAAQKTLENVIAGASIIFDKAVRVGDVLRMGEVLGTVDHVGLRSTRIRTLDRTVVSIPNSQIANASLETFSARDRFWFHPIVGLRYETTPEQLRRVVDDIRHLLTDHPLADTQSVRVRFFRLGAFSLDVEVFAYLQARDWSHFLEIQEQLLFAVTEIVSRAGTSIAFPSQTMYVENAAMPMAFPPR
jgi:MscS family membrane protein